MLDTMIAAAETPIEKMTVMPVIPANFKRPYSNRHAFPIEVSVSMNI